MIKLSKNRQKKKPQAKKQTYVVSGISFFYTEFIMRNILLCSWQHPVNLVDWKRVSSVDDKALFLSSSI